MACSIELDGEFINCDICFEVFDNPQSLVCRHVFCQKCVDRIKDGTKIECPVCKVHCIVSDIKPDYRTVCMVDSYRKNLTKESSVIKTKGDFVSKCEICEDDGSEVSYKCETCDFLLCDKCEVSHKARGSNDGTHITKAIAAIAADARTEVNKGLQQLKIQEDILATTLSNRQEALNDIRKVSDNAMKNITENEENLIVKIKCHHENLRKAVEKEKTQHVKKSKKEYENIEDCYHDVKGNQAMLKSWMQNKSDLSVANTAGKLQKKLQDIEKESAKIQQTGASIENFTVKVVEGNAYNTNGSTKMIISTNQSTDGKGSEQDGAIASVKSEIKEASGSTPSDYTTAQYRDYKAEKTVGIPGTPVYHLVRIDKIQHYNQHLYCMAEEKIHVYTENLAPVKIITLNHNDDVDCRDFVFLNNKYLITASSSADNGLRIVDIDSKDIQRICCGQFYGIAMHNQKLYAYEYNINKVLIFQTTEDYWKQTGEIYLNYYTNAHKAEAITSFHMKNEQLYISDNTTIYHLDIHGKLKRRIDRGKDNMFKNLFKNPRICSVDSKGNLLVVEPEKRKSIVVGADRKCGEVMLQGVNLKNIYSVFMGEQNECLWVAHYEENKSSHLTKYATNKIL